MLCCVICFICIMFIVAHMRRPYFYIPDAWHFVWSVLSQEMTYFPFTSCYYWTKPWRIVLAFIWSNLQCYSVCLKGQVTLKTKLLSQLQLFAYIWYFQGIYLTWSFDCSFTKMYPIMTLLDVNPDLFWIVTDGIFICN